MTYSQSNERNVNLKRALVMGYDSNNLGDDLFFYQLTKRYPTTRFTFESGRDLKILRDIDNADAGNYRLKNLFTEVRKFDVFILIGGSMFQQIKGQPWCKAWLGLLIKTLLFKLFGKKVVFVGFNFGPYYSKTFYTLYKLIFSLVDFISVRDEKTLDLFKKNRRVHLFPDMVFNLDDSKFISPRSKSLGISVMDFGPNIKFQHSYETFIEQIIDRVDSNIKITLYGFQSSSSIDDNVVIDRLKRQSNRLVNSVCYNGNNMDFFLKDYYKNFFTITSRFHSLVLSLKARQQIISVDYNIKVQSLLDTLKINNMDIQVNEFRNEKVVQEVVDKINTALLIDGNYLNSDELDSVIKQSANHFKFLDSLLGMDYEKNNV